MRPRAARAALHHRIRLPAAEGPGPISHRNRKPARLQPRRPGAVSRASRLAAPGSRTIRCQRPSDCAQPMEETDMSKSHDQKKDKKKPAQKSAKEKRQEKREKKRQ